MTLDLLTVELRRIAMSERKTLQFPEESTLARGRVFCFRLGANSRGIQKLFTAC